MTFSKHTPENLPTLDNSIQYVVHWKFQQSTIAGLDSMDWTHWMDPWTWNLRIIS